jgi:hypothetical protein
MHLSRFASVLVVAAAPVACAAAWPLAVQGQVRQVVSKEVSVGRTSASLELEFADGGSLEIAFEGDRVLVDGRDAGSFEPGGDLEAAWRGLLGQAVALDDGPLAEALAAWSPPGGLDRAAADLARRLDRALEDALRSREAPADAAARAVAEEDVGMLVRSLTRSSTRLSLLEEALAGLEGELHVHVDQDVEVAADEVVRGTLLVVESDLRVAGRVDGDVIAIGGTVELRDGSVVTGEVRLVDATLRRDEGAEAGGVIDVADDGQGLQARIREEIRAEMREQALRDLRNELRAAERGEDDEGLSLFAPFRPILRGVGGVIENLVAVFVLALVGAGVIAFGGDKLDVIAEAVRRAPARAAAVGIAGTVLLIPIWVIGFVALLVSIVGIPLAIAWLPVFPLAACAAAVVGYLAVARNTGEWLADSGYPWTHWIRKSNSLMTMIGGLLALVALFVLANVVSMAPLPGFVDGLLVAAGVIVTVVATEIGFGAVILTRGGRRREPWRYEGREAWDAAMEDVDVEDLEGAAPAGAPGPEEPAGA